MKIKKTIAVSAAVVLLMLLCTQGCGKKTEEANSLEIGGDAGQMETENSEETISGLKDDAREEAASEEEDSEEEDSEEEDLKEEDLKEETFKEQALKNEASKDVASKDIASNEQSSIVSSGITSPAVSGALHVEGTQLMDSNGNAVQLKGISTHGLAWFPDYVNEDCFRQLRQEWNANVVRLAMYTAEYGGYCSGGNKDSLKELVKSGVEYATAQDMYVIIDWHILSDNNPNMYIDEAKTFFTEMTQEYADYDNVLYEICNEPNGSTGWKEVKSYAEEVIGIIRSYDEDAIIIVGTPNWCQYVDQAAADPITGYDNIMYALHFYAATHKESLRNAMTAAIDSGLPIFVSEYGICDASGNGGIDEWQANQWVDTMNTYGVSYVAWNLSNKNETSAIFNSNCSKTSGFTDSDLSASGKWLYQMLTGDSVMGNSNEVRPQDNGANSGSDNEETPQDNGANSGSDNEETPQDNGANSGSDNEETPPHNFFSGELTYTAEIKNSWESEGKTCYQYEVTLQNTSSSDCGMWSLDLSFNEDISFMDGWNGEYSASGKTLHITCKDYNGSIPAGGSITGIGFIISGSANLTVTE